MPIRPSVATAALIIATLAAAAGLNLAVMGLGQPADNEVLAEGSTTEPVGETEVRLTSGSVAAPAAANAAPGEPVAPMAVALVADQKATARASGGPPAEDHDSENDSSDHDSGDDGAEHRESRPEDAEDDEHQDSEHDDAVDDDKRSTGTAPTTPSTPPSGVTSTTAGPPSTTGPTNPAPPVTAPPSSAAPTSPPATEYLTYEFEGVASIVVALHADDRLEYWSVRPVEGWVYLVEDRGPDQVKIKFRPKAGGEEAEFEVEFEGGRLKVKREY